MRDAPTSGAERATFRETLHQECPRAYERVKAGAVRFRAVILA